MVTPHIIAPTQYTPQQSHPWQYLRCSAFQGGLFAIVWWILTEGAPASWIVGVPAVIAATAVSLALRPTFHWRLQMSSCMRFVGFFLRESWRGGVDVAWRAMQPRMPIAPFLVEYPFRLPEGAARVFLANTVSLLPGTLSAAFHGDRLTVHVLTGAPDTVVAELQTLETYVAALFGVELSLLVSTTE